MNNPEYLYYQQLLNDKIGTPQMPVSYSAPVQGGYSGQGQPVGQQSNPLSDAMKVYKNGKKLYDMFGSSPLSSGANGLNVGELGIGNPASYTPAANALASMAATNTAATGGLVGGAPIAQLAAAESGLSSGAAGATGTVAPGMAAVAPYLGAAAMAAIAYGGWNARKKNRDRDSIGPESILRAHEDGKLTFRGQEMDIVDGRYLYDPFATATQSGGRPVYYDLKDPQFIERMRGSFDHQLRRRASMGVGDRDRREELFKEQGGRPTFRNRGEESPNAHNNALSAYNSYSPSQQTAEDIRNSNKNLFASLLSSMENRPKSSIRGRYKK